MFISKTVEIDGEEYQAALPMCGGCPHLVIGSGCIHNGCKYPERRKERPKTKKEVSDDRV